MLKDGCFLTQCFNLNTAVTGADMLTAGYSHEVEGKCQQRGRKDIGGNVVERGKQKSNVLLHV